ncbi:MAG: UvrD-helicase domain-containing protein, partial [Sphingopyxis sp.]
SLKRARTLFARVIDAPGRGLAIQTIHSFAQSLLASFPEEAALAPGFRALDDREIAQMRHDVLIDMIDQATQDGDQPLLDALAAMALETGETAVTAYLDRCAGAVTALAGLPASAGDNVRWLRGQLGLPVDVSAQDWAMAQCGDDAAPIASLRMLAAAMVEAGVALKQETPAILGWLALPVAGRADQLAGLVNAFYNQENGLRALYSTKKMASVTDLAIRAGEWARDIATQTEHLTMTDRMGAALSVGRLFAASYTVRKRQQGVVDYDDLIQRTGLLLAQGGQADWVRYKLDSRIDHILVDEAQDTNADQWAIIRGLTAEFFAGLGAAGDAVRTLFVVGDYKQAIYGFQGTAPQFFDDARIDFRVAGERAGRPFSDLHIDANFRSSAPILRVVDRVIEQLGPPALGLDADAVRHNAFADRAPGTVAVWPMEPAHASGAADATDDGAADDDDGADYDDAGGDADDDGRDGHNGAGDDAARIDKPTRRVADKIARTVRHWIDHGLNGSAVRASDILVLVRQRTTLAALIVSRLQANGVPVAGVDRLKLYQPIVVQDILAAARFALQPLDDLTLANLLLSPIIGWTHDDLIRFGYRERGVALWPHLRAQAQDGGPLSGQLEPLYQLLRMAGYVTPYRFFEQILSGPLRGREKLTARLGNAARDPIEELLNQSLDFESREGTSMHAFLNWFDRGEMDIKREVDNQADEVRVMTVHGSKGLQARIVILADAAAAPKGFDKAK